jgi:hypothetical protein
VATPGTGSRLPGATLTAPTLIPDTVIPLGPVQPGKRRLIPSSSGYRVIAGAHLCNRDSNCGLFRKPIFRPVADCCRIFGQRWEGTT